MIEIRIVPSSPEELARVVELLKSFGGTLGEAPAAAPLPPLPEPSGETLVFRRYEPQLSTIAKAELDAAYPIAPAPAQDEPTAPAPAPAEPPAPPAAPEVTLEQVRAQLAALAAAGKKAEVRDLLAQVGAERLTEVSPKLYGFLLEKAQALR